jgi:hypothetical protein
MLTALTKQKKVLYLILTLLILFYAPYISVYVANGSIPKDYFHFPPTDPPPTKAGYNLYAFILIAIVFIAVVLLLVYPKLFGFKKIRSERKIIRRAHLPYWFWIGLVAWLAALIMFTGKYNHPAWLLDWGLLPLWWGFILMLDGLVYYRTGGNSLIHNEPTEIIAMGVVSISGWLIFEYFNFFINLNWYYPNAHLKGHDEFLLYAVFGSSAFIPMTFEWYFLLRSFNFFNSHYRHGPKLNINKKILLAVLIISIIGMYLAPKHSDLLFFILWLGPLVILSIVLEILGIWTPFNAIKQRGDWTSLLVFAPTFLFQGFLLECWNYLSAGHNNNQPQTNNPAYWVYCIPYVSNYHVFEMPILGYLGYIPFSVYCWIWWITTTYLMNISTKYSLHDDFK